MYVHMRDKGLQVTPHQTAAGTVDGVVQIVPGGLRARRVNKLGMRCNNEDIPEPTADVKILGQWAAACEFSGVSGWSGHQATGPKLQSLKMAVTTHRLYAILSRAGVEDQVWLAVARSAIRVRGIGQKGVLKKRPATVEITGEGWMATLTDVDRIFRASQRYQSGQERSLIEAIQAPLAARPEPVNESTLPTPSGGEWMQSPAEGVYVHRINGAMTGATSLVDPTAPLSEQVAQARTHTWLPGNILDSQIDRVIAGVNPNTAELAPGRSRSPIGIPFLAIVTPPQPDDSKLRAYLWPRVTSAGQPELEPGESISLSWQTARPGGYWVKDDLLPGFPGFNLVPGSFAPQVVWSLTNHRVILLAPSDPAGRFGVMHMRFEWLCALNIETYRYPGNTKPPRLNLNMVSGDPKEDRVAIWLNTDNSHEDVSGPIARAVLKAVQDFGVTMGKPRERISDNGKKGLLSWSHYHVNNGGLTIPQGTLGLSTL